jgi:hypothetical protein
LPQARASLILAARSDMILAARGLRHGNRLRDACRDTEGLGALVACEDALDNGVAQSGCHQFFGCDMFSITAREIPMPVSLRRRAAYLPGARSLQGGV